MMDRSISQEKQLAKRQKLNKSDTNMGDTEGDSQTNRMDINDDAESDKSESSSEDEIDNDQIYALQHNIEYINAEVTELQKEMVRMRDHSNETELKYDLLVQTTVKKDKDLVTLKNRVLELEKRSMNRNIRINNLPERPKEIPARIVNSYLEGKIENAHYDIEVAHRNGPKFDDNEDRARPMIVQLKSRGMVDKILKVTKNEGEYKRDAIRVARQVPTELRHITAKLYHLADFAKKCHPNAKVEIKDKAIFVNNQKRKPPLVPPTLERTLTSNNDEIDIMKNINFFASDLLGLKGSTFRAFVSPASCVEDARYAYLAISRFPGVTSATHLISAYLTQDDFYDYFDDGDHGLGRHVFELMNQKGLKGAIIFLSRDFGGIHLGKDRFTLINKVVKQAMSKYNAAVTRNPKLLKPERLQINLDEESTLMGMVPKREPKPASATNLAEQTAKRLRTLQQGGQALTQYTEEQTGLEEQEDEMQGESDNISNQKDGTRHKPNYNGPPIYPQGPPPRENPWKGYMLLFELDH
jgi:hypothetical protein